MHEKTKLAKEEIERLSVGGVIEPRAVVEAARDPDSVLHDYFEWNDSTAAEAYRIVQARQLLRTFVVHVGEPAVATRAFVSLTSDRISGGGYRATIDVLSDDELREQMLQDALEEFQSFEEKYSQVTALAPVFQAARKVKRRHVRPEARIAA